MNYLKYTGHLSHFTFALIGFFVLILLNIFRGHPNSQFMIITLFVLTYVFWGMIHHINDKTYRLKIVLEYILFGAIALFILKLFLL